MAQGAELNKALEDTHNLHFQKSLREFTSQFFEMVPVRRIKWKADDAALLVSSPELQVQLLNATVSHPLCRRFPPALSYRRYFMKLLIQKLESGDADIADEVYEAYTDLLSFPEEDEETLCYKSYLMPSGEFVSLQESIHLVSQGTTGLSTWQAAQHLAEWILENPQTVADRTVTELGCGLGFTGIVACKCSCVKSYTFTDCHPQVLYLLSKNIQQNLSCDKRIPEDSPTAKEEKILKKIRKQLSLSTSSTEADRHEDLCNDPNLSETITRLTDCDQISVCGDEEKAFEQENLCPNPQYWSSHFSCQVSSFKGCNSPKVNMCCLDWESMDEALVEAIRADVILAADVVYDLSIIPALVYVLKQLLDPGQGKGHTTPGQDSPRAFVASTIRNEDTRDAFLIAMASEGLSHKVMDGPEAQHFFYERSVPIEILEFCVS